MILFKSVKFRLTLWYAFVLAILLLIFSCLMRAELARALYRDADKSLSHEALKIEDSMERYLVEAFRGYALRDPKMIQLDGAGFQPEIQAKLRDVVRIWEKSTQWLRRSTTMIHLVDLNHQPIVSNLKGWAGQIILPDYERDSVFMETGSSLQTIHFQKKPIRLYYHLITYQGMPVFVIQCGISLEDLKKALNRLDLIILILIPLAVVAACIAGWFLAKRSFRPVDAMIREAQKISTAASQSRLPRTQAGDEVDRLAETLNEMMDRLEQSTLAIKEFSSNISHELKTPLAIIRGEIDLALRKSRSSEALVETLRVIEGEVNELIRLVDDLMLLVRSDAKQLKFDRRPVAVDELIKSVIERFRERAQEKKLHMFFQSSTVQTMQGDSVYLKRLFSNLLDNAIKFTPEGGRIEVAVKMDGGWVLIEFKDTGIGIDAEVQSKVFSRFYRTDQARSYEGAGLGLNIAQAICAGHGGNLTILSQSEKGTQVTVRLPLFIGV